jgi:hypothetical protein
MLKNCEEYMANFVGCALIGPQVYEHPHQCMKDGWMVWGQETIFCWIALPKLTMVVNSVDVFLTTYLP